MENSFKSKLKDCLLLFLVFLKIGTVTFGGGYAMISLLENECVQKRKWLTSDDFFKLVAISETTPGPIAINMATYIGYKKCGLIGSFLCTLGVVLPAFIIIFVISLFFDNFLAIPIISAAFHGIKVGVAVVVLFAGLKMIKKIKKNVFAFILMILALGANLTISLLSVKFSTIYLILIGGALGFIAFLIENRDSLKKKTVKEYATQNDNVDDNQNDTIICENNLKNAENTENIVEILDENVSLDNNNSIDNDNENQKQEEDK